jgi:hypothetical protein
MTVKYTSDHEWISFDEAGPATVGITQHAQDALGDVVFVDLPAVGKTFAKGEVAGVVESVKAAADLYMPVAASRRGQRVAARRSLRSPTAIRRRRAGSSRSRSRIRTRPTPCSTRARTTSSSRTPDADLRAPALSPTPSPC